MYGVKHFHAYLLAHKFMLQTDHEPLRTLFSESKAVPPHASIQPDSEVGMDPCIIRVFDCLQKDR